MESPPRPPLSLERYAEVNARIAAGEARPQVLASLSVDDARWEATQEYWLERMSRESDRARFATAQRYGEAYKAALARAVRAVAVAAREKRRNRGTARPAIVLGVPGVPDRSPVSQAAPSSGPPPSSAPASSAPPQSAIPPSSLPPSLVGYTARLSVEQLAAMRAELATTPEAEHPAAKLRFGLDAVAWANEEAHWQSRLRKDPSLFKTYVSRFQYFRALMQRG